MKAFRRMVVMCAALATLSNVAFGYYHFTYFVQRSGPFAPVWRKFDLNSLPGGVVPFFIARQGPSKLVDGDNFTALVSDIRRAGEAWNVKGPAIKTQFAGFTDTTDLSAITDQATPGIDVEFDDTNLPPGVLAQTVPATYKDLHYLGTPGAPNFAPILRSRVQLASDLTVRAQASYSDTFFTTIVHEFGHALGLQHSLTNSAMSTSVIRSTTKALPITPDDVAGLAALYPTADFSAQTGSIVGHVSAANKDANLASVVALRQSDGLVIGGMTQPDGNYRIDGLPPGDYIVYAHPIPPIQTDGGDAAALQAPVDLDGVPFAATAGFQTRFVGNGGVTQDWNQAAHFFVQAGQVTPAHADFALDPLSSQGPYDINMWGFVGSTGTTVLAPPLPVGYKNWMAFYGQNVITAPSQMVPALQVSAIGSAATLDQTTLQIYDPFSQYLPIIVATANPVDRTTQVAVAFSAGDALYISPRAFNVVPSQHPRITGVAQGTDSDGQAVALISGENMDRTKVLFDGSEALRVVKKDDGTIEALPPPGTNGYSAVVDLLGPDGQTSWQLLQPFWQLQGDSVLFKYTYPPSGPNSYALGTGSILAGTDQMLEIRGAGTNFISGRTEVGFGTADVVVRQLWVMAPDRIWLNVSANPKAKLGNVPVTISTGLQTVTGGVPLQVSAPPANQSSLLAPILNDATGLAGVPSGGTIAFRGTGLPATSVGWIANIGGMFRDVQRGTDGLLRVAVPAGLAPGPTTINVSLPTGGVPTLLFQVDAAPPVIQSVTKIGGSNAATVSNLDQLSVKVAGLGSGEYIDPARVEVRVAGVLQTVTTINWEKDTSLYSLEFTLTDTVVPGDALPVTVLLGTRISSAVPLSVGSAPPVGQ